MAEKILGLVDAENLYYTPKQKWGIKAKVDFLKLYNMITRRERSAKVIIYLVADPVIDQEAFFRKLVKIGYTPRVKILYPNAGKQQNSNWDDEIIEDGTTLMPDYDRLVLVSGDGGFSSMLRAYRMQRKPTRVLCFKDDFSPQLKCASSISFLDERILLNTYRTMRYHFPMQ